MLTGGTGTYDSMTLLMRDASIHGYSFFRPLHHPGLLERLIGIGMEYAAKLTPLLAESFSFDKAPEAFEALARSEHIGKITITI